MKYILNNTGSVVEPRITRKQTSLLSGEIREEKRVPQTEKKLNCSRTHYMYYVEDVTFASGEEGRMPSFAVLLLSLPYSIVHLLVLFAVQIA